MTRVRLNKTRATVRVSRNKTRKNLTMKGGENENQKAESQFMDIKECKRVKNIGNKFKGIAITKDHDYIIANSEENCIQKLTRGGELFTLTTGVEKEGDIDFSKPMGVAIDEKGDIYVADSGNNRICKVNIDKKYHDDVISIDVIVGSDKGLKNPMDVLVENDKIFVADTGNNCIKEIVGVKITAHKDDINPLSNPQGIAFGLDGYLIIADTGNHCIREMNRDSNKMKVIAGTIGAEPQEIKNGDEKKPLDARLNNPVSVDVDKSGNIFIVDKGNNAIRVLTKKGISTIQISVSKDDVEADAESDSTSDSESDSESDFESDTAPAPAAPAIDTDTAAPAAEAEAPAPAPAAAAAEAEAPAAEAAIDTDTAAPAPAPAAAAAAPAAAAAAPAPASPAPASPAAPTQSKKVQDPMLATITGGSGKKKRIIRGGAGKDTGDITEPYGITINNKDVVVTENNKIRIIKNIAKETSPGLLEKLFGAKWF